MPAALLFFIASGPKIKDYYRYYVANENQQIKTVFNINAEHGQVCVLGL